MKEGRTDSKRIYEENLYLNDIKLKQNGDSFIPVHPKTRNDVISAWLWLNLF